MLKVDAQGASNPKPKMEASSDANNMWVAYPEVYSVGPGTLNTFMEEAMGLIIVKWQELT